MRRPSPSSFFTCFVVVVSCCSVVVGQQKKPKQPFPDFTKPLWKHTTVAMPTLFGKAVMNKGKPWIDQAKDVHPEVPLIPGFRPVIFGKRPLVVARTHEGIVGWALKPTTDIDGTKLPAGGVEWKGVGFRASLDPLLEIFQARVCRNWLQAAKKMNLRVLLCENTLVGSFSTDGKTVYTIDGLQVIPPEAVLVNLKQQPPRQLFPTEVMEMLRGNSLRAFDLETGKIVWARGIEDNVLVPVNKMEGHFVGVPYPAKKTLYCLHESNKGDVNLIEFDPTDGTIKNKHVLTKIADTYFLSRLRRVHGVRLAAAGNLLLCPTHAGLLIAFDTKKQKVAWTFKYRDPTNLVRLKSLGTSWKHPKVIVAKGKAIFTAPDADDIFCVDLKNGNKLWKAPRKDGVYLAGHFDGNLVVVAKDQVRGLTLKNGQTTWSVKTGVPSGLGGEHKGKYFLPLAKGAKSKKPEVAVLDLKQGKVLARLPVTKGDRIGNLVFAGDAVISQTVAKVTAYPIKK